MRVALAAIIVAAVAAPLAACEREAATMPDKPVETPKRKPGLWVQTTHIEAMGDLPPISLCIDVASDAKMAWWGQQGVRGACLKNDVAKNDDGSWSFESVCQTEGNIRTTSRGTASGDFNSAYAVDVQTTTEGAPIPDLNRTQNVTMGFEWQGECPVDMKPGDMRLPDGSVVNYVDRVGG
ncbi:MAG TPA: DUF3617 family protein [Caulobacteraceae bacterium]|nr:DUF3617 family protein [Caulobacteraceae bacterium]